MRFCCWDWSNGMTVGQGGPFPSDLVYGRTIRTVAAQGYIVVAAQVEGMRGKDGSQGASGVEQVISESQWSKYASNKAVGHMGHSRWQNLYMLVKRLAKKTEK